jgi:actin-related protein 2
MVGDEASKYRALLNLSRPTEEGRVKNWEDMEILLRYSFEQINLKDASGCSVFITEPVMNPVENKLGLLKIMF